jgi:hypothetical protein
MLITSENELVCKLCKILGLPKYTKEFTLRCAVGGIVTIECEYYPSFNIDEHGELITEFKKYKLQEIEEDNQKGSDI